MKKVWQKPAIINIISCLTIYLCFAFSEWEINPAVWSEVKRIFAAWLIGISSFISLFVYLQILSD